MEIDIPDLDDIKFSYVCRCTGPSYKPTEPDKSCPRCEGRGFRVSGAGDELLRFLKEQGFRPTHINLTGY